MTIFSSVGFLKLKNLKALLWGGGAACRSSQARDRTHATVVTRATVVTTPDS